MKQNTIRILTLALSSLVLIPSIAHADRRVWPNPDWQVSTPEKEGMSASKLDDLKAYFGKHNSEAALVIRHGKIVAEWYWGDKNAESKIQAFSVTKSISSTAIGDIT